jgi:hypothetical protein
MRHRQDVVPVVLCSLLALGIAGAVAAQTRAPAKPQPKAETVAVRLWTASGGEVGIRWNRDLARDLGIGIAADGVRGTRAQDGSERFAVSGDALQFRVENGYLRGFGAGKVQARGGYALTLKDGRIDLGNFRVVPHAGGNGKGGLRLDLVDADGIAWFYVDRIMHEVFDGTEPTLTVSSSDIRISPRLALRVGHPYAAGWAIGELQLDLAVTAKGSGVVAQGSTTFHWHGDAAPDDGTYQNDLFMEETFAQYTRCQGCTGNNGSGRVAITPSSTLVNNVNAGTIQTTVPGDPLGTSTALWTAGIPWYTKFSGNFPPYGNDQHPFLIWNMYRLNADGSIEQIGRSGVKQAFLTVNNGCMDFEPPDHNSHVLGRGCADTYSTGNNDYTQGLSPRSELLPALGIWGRCGSTFDPDCNGSQNTGPGDDYWQRLVVGESQIAPSAGASWLFESWYLAREDINIYNSMSTLATTQSWTGSVWNIISSSERLGSAIDRWYAIGASSNPRLDTHRRHIEELVVDGAHAKVAVKVRPLGNRQWRYDYAVMNFEFAFGTLSGTNPDLRVSDNQGFDGFAISTASAARGTPVFRDGDLDTGNDWQYTATANAGKWSDADGAPNSLWWGGLYSFSLISANGPMLGEATLYADNAPEPRSYTVRTLVPRP